MRKSNFLLAICCLFSIYACQKETLAPLPESTTITTETTDESQYFKINTLEDLAIFETLFISKEGAAASRGNIHGKIVHVPNNSKNAIQAAIAEAGRYGLVVLAKGNHYEDETIVIDHPVYILGRKGATVIANSELSVISASFPVFPIFSIRQTTRVTIWGVAMQGGENFSNTAIEILNSTHTVVSKNTIQNFQIGTIVNKGDHSLFWKNEIVGLSGLSITGISVANGTAIRIIQNKISAFDWNILCGGKDGIIQENELFGSRNIGLDLSFFPPILQTSAGDIVGSSIPATNWWVQDNYAHHNIVGYSVDSGANNNTLINNRGENNEILDLSLSQERPNALGIIMPASVDNFVDARDNTEFTIQDCGDNNRVVGGIMIPCN